MESRNRPAAAQHAVCQDKLFVSTGRKAILTCGTADGNITSVTVPNQEPSETGQANFGSVGADYVSAAGMQWL